MIKFDMMVEVKAIVCYVWMFFFKVCWVLD